jgi:hypothetical protein
VLCELCSALLSDICVKDCMQVYGGAAIIDDCGVCSGGRSVGCALKTLLCVFLY